MKKFALALCILLILSFLGCGTPDTPTPTLSVAEPKTTLQVPQESSEEVPGPTETAVENVLPPALAEGPDGPLAIIYTDYYRLKAPISWGNTGLSKITPLDSGGYSLTIYEHDAYFSFGGGKLSTLMMVPTSDDSYKDFPDYELLCALDTPEGSFYVVALFPTDVQFDADTAEGYNAMYEELMDVLYTIRPVGDIEMAMP